MMVNKVEQEAKDNEVFQDLGITVFTPSRVIDITYGDHKVQLGNELTPTQVKEIPSVSYVANVGSYYTLLLTDPDAPTRKDAKWREWNHWGVVNIPEARVNEGETITEYIGSAPPPESGLHRYIFILARQPEGKIAFSEPHLPNNSGKGREHFKVANLIQKYKLIPEAINFFQAQYDDYVPTAYKKLGF